MPRRQSFIGVTGYQPKKVIALTDFILSINNRLYFCTDNRKHLETHIERKLGFVILFQMYFFSSSTKAKTVVADSAFAGNEMSIS